MKLIDSKNKLTESLIHRLNEIEETPEDTSSEDLDRISHLNSVFASLADETEAAFSKYNGRFEFGKPDGKVKNDIHGKPYIEGFLYEIPVGNIRFRLTCEYYSLDNSCDLGFNISGSAFNASKRVFTPEDANTLVEVTNTAWKLLDEFKEVLTREGLEPDDTRYKIYEAFNPENEDKNKIIRQALKGPKSYNKNLKDLQKMGINKGYKEMDDDYYGSTIFLNGPNGKQLSVDPDGTNVWNVAGDTTRKHYKKELSYKNRHSDYYTKYDTMDFNGDKAKSFDYYNYLTKPQNEYQDEVDNANKAKTYRDNKDKTGYNLPDEALTPEEKSLNKRPRKYVQLNKDKEELEDELAGYDEVKSKLDKTNRELKKLHNKNYK